MTTAWPKSFPQFFAQLSKVWQTAAVQLENWVGSWGSRWPCLVALWLICLVNLGFAAPATAAEQSISAPANPSVNQIELAPEPTRLDADDISAEKIHQFVQAYLQVLALIEGRETELQGAEMEFESQQIQREIEAQAVALIQAAGLTLQEYLQLLSFTNIDPEFGERVAAQLQEATQ